MDVLPVVGRVYNEVDAVVHREVYSVFWSVFGVELTSTPATTGLLFVDSPTPVVIAVSLYLIVVAVGLLWISANNLKPPPHEPASALQLALVLVHNFSCFALSLYMCVGITSQAIVLRYSLWGNSYNPKQKEMAILIYLFYMSKYMEFMDTIIMLLKRSTRQISFLHVYHHSSISLIWWAIVHHAPGGDVGTGAGGNNPLFYSSSAAYFSAALNSGVHVLMYAYYFLAAVLRSNSKLRAKYLFWGRYLTQFQIFQFMLNLIQAYYGMKTNVPYPQWLFKTLFYYMISLLVLFGNFYVQKYIKPSSEKQKGAKIE